MNLLLFYFVFCPTCSQVEVCGSQFTSSWLGALYAYKGLLLVVGGYMAWETRNVKLQALNDAQYIGLSVYRYFCCCGTLCEYF